MKRLIVIALATTTLVQSGGAVAQEYPVRPIRMIVPFPPSGPNDVLGRIFAQRVGELLGQSIVIDNRSGAGGTMGTDLAAKASADGYTLLFSGTASLSINPSLQKQLPYDPIKDFAPISLVGTAPSVMVIHPGLPVKNVTELIGLAKYKPDQLNFASGGIGGAPHLAGELFKSMAGIRMTHVPYKGASPALTALIAGEVQIYFGGISSILPLMGSGKVRAIAVTSARPTPLLPGVPTLTSSGLPGYEISNWYAVVAPAATPKAIVARLNEKFVKVIAEPNVAARLADLGIDPAPSTPQELGTYIRAEITKWAKVIAGAGIKPE